jgi:hypothetical protein
MISTYQTELIPLVDELRDLKYQYMAMEYNNDTNTHTLVKKIFTLQDMTVPFDKPVVESFVIGSVDNEENSKRNLINSIRDDSHQGDY